MLELHVNFFELVTYYVVQICETLLFIAVVLFVLIHGLCHLWNLLRETW